MKSKFSVISVRSLLFIAMLSMATVQYLAAADVPPTTAQTSLQTNTNTALVPVTWLERDSYNWNERHAQVLAEQKSIDPQIVMIGDSITHFWGGPPISRQQNGPKAWAATFGDHRVMNIGFGWDRTQNVLWRLDHGEMDGTHPKVVVINIGSNNLTGTRNARANTPAEIAEAIMTICDRVHKKSPESRIIVMGVLPRGFKPDDYYRTNITALNKLLAAQLTSKPLISFLDISEQIVARDAEMSRDLMPDGVHPSETGYAIWGKALVAAGVLK